MVTEHNYDLAVKTDSISALGQNFSVADLSNKAGQLPN